MEYPELQLALGVVPKQQLKLLCCSTHPSPPLVSKPSLIQKFISPEVAHWTLCRQFTPCHFVQLANEIICHVKKSSFKDYPAFQY